MAGTKIAVRADASVLSGTGHIVRTLSLAEELRRSGAEVCFVCREHLGHSFATIRNAGFEVIGLPTCASRTDPLGAGYQNWLGCSPALDAQQTVRALARRSIDWLIVDHYSLGATWESALREIVGGVLAIDDLADRPHDVDILLDQNYHGSQTSCRYDTFVPATARRLLGPRFALLQPEYSSFRRTVAVRDAEIFRVGVFFGGSDLTDMTSQVVNALDCQELRSLLVDVVVGQNHPRIAEVMRLARSRARTQVLMGLDSLSALWARADLGIGAGGGATWERACLGLPSVVVPVAANQLGSSRALASAGYQVVVEAEGEDNSSALREKILTFLRDRERVCVVGRRAATLVDGLGAKRVATTLLGASGQPIRVRPADSLDEGLLHDWVNDADVRRHSFNSSPIPASVHERWFAQKLTDPDCLILIAETLSGLPVGQVRFERRADAKQQSVVDISVEPIVRGQQFGGRILDLAVREYRRQWPRQTVFAYVKEDNIASVRLFRRAGFRTIPAEREGHWAFVFPEAPSDS